MKKYGRTTVSEFLGDFLVYRNLVPVDTRLPQLAEISERIGLPAGMVPRKTTNEYAQAIAIFLEEACEIVHPGSQIKQVIFVGDTRLNDGTAFRNICRAGNWQGMAFIGSEDERPPEVEISELEEGTLFLSNRWQALREFNHLCQQRDFRIGENTAVLIDLDKTTLGARGRNDQVIDQVRLEAAKKTIGNVLGDDFDEQNFEAAYRRLNRSEFHAFTMDNQDTLVYACIMLGIGLFDLDSLVERVLSGQMATFDDFLANVDWRTEELPTRVRRIHDDFSTRVQQGDPTPFKEFRRMEYKTTIARMGHMDESAPVEQLLAQEITITQEVRETALGWRDNGALLFGISDKPDEASLPTAEQESQDYKPLHRKETDAVGV